MNKRKLLLTLTALLFAAVTYAGGIKICQGNAKYLKEDGSISVVFNWDKALWDNEKPVKERWGDQYQEYIDKGQTSFIAGFNKGSKKMKIVDDRDTANIVMSVTFVNFDYYFSTMSLIPGHKHKVWAEITIIEKVTGNVLCKYSVDEYKGDRDLSVFDSFTEMMSKMATELAKTK